MVERWAAGAHARLRRLPPVAVAEPPVGRAKAFVRTRSAAVVAADSRTRRKARYEDVRRRFLAGGSLRAIGKATGLAHATVRKHAHAAVFPERAARAPVPSIIDPHLPHLQARLAEGCRNAAQLWRECRERGFAGTPKQIRRWLQDRRTVFHQHTPYRWRDVVPPAAAAPPASAGPPLPTPKRLAWIIAKDPGTRSPEEAAAIARVEQDAAAATLVRLVGRFVDLVRAAGITGGQHRTDAPDPIGDWVADARHAGVGAVATFAAGIEHDGAAVRAALTTPWSNAQAEGQVTKLKLLKRSMYGRAKLDLLRQRLLLAT